MGTTYDLKEIEIMEFLEARGGRGNKIIARFSFCPEFLRSFFNFLRMNLAAGSRRAMVTYSCEERDKLISYLNNNGIEARPLFYQSIILFLNQNDLSDLGAI